MPRNCRACARLWEEYQSRVKAHIDALGKYQEAMIHQDSSALARLDPVLQNAAKLRAAAREAVKRHEATHVLLTR